MENVINRIIKIEERANEILSDTQRQKADLQNNIDKDIEVIRADIAEKVSQKYENIKAFEKEYADKKTEEISLAYKKAEDKLDALYESKKEEWINSIYNDIVGKN